MDNLPPKLGDFGLVRTPDIGGRIIRIGTDSWMNHALVYVGDNNVIEARPGGAGFNVIDNYSNPKFHLTWSTDLIPLTDDERAKIVHYALAQKGVKYGWPDIAALSLKTLGYDTPAWVDKRIERDDRLICSQLVDRAYMLSGVHLFNDGRLSMDVTPGDLWNLVLDLRHG
jgi:hypothetical protein